MTQTIAATPLELANAGKFRELFIERLGWCSPDMAPFTIEHDGVTYDVVNAASHHGVRVFVIEDQVNPATRHVLERKLEKFAAERLMIVNYYGVQRWTYRGHTATHHAYADYSERLDAILAGLTLSWDAETGPYALSLLLRDAI
jgi:hypothetical protein